jgi:hypothetical protein
VRVCVCVCVCVCVFGTLSCAELYRVDVFLCVTFLCRTSLSVNDDDVCFLQVVICDRDRPATCSIINDPHITTFDGR